MRETREAETSIPHWVMVIDLRRCFGCQVCVMACKQCNHVPPDHWRWLVDCGVGESPERQRTFLPMNCVHCGDPPCQQVCPTGATYRRADGIVAIDHSLCTGCGYCVVACPFHARTILMAKDYGRPTGNWPQGADLIALAEQNLGVASKCNFCLNRIDAGLERGLVPGADPDAAPACVVNCSARAISFGDLNDENSEVSRLISSNRTSRPQEELGTNPSLYYIVA